MLTEEEHEKLVEVGNKFYKEFSELCNRYINESPKHLKVYYEAYLGEKTSIYGRKHD